MSGDGVKAGGPNAPWTQVSDWTADANLARYRDADYTTVAHISQIVYRAAQIQGRQSSLSLLRNHRIWATLRANAAYDWSG
jgi:hypothetical protein